MKKGKVVLNLVEEMKKLVEKNVSHYKSDLDIDLKEIIFTNKEYGETSFYWICRDSGTNLMRSSLVEAKGSFSNIELKHYLDDKTAKIFLINIENIVEENETVKIMGSLTKKKYKSVYEDIMKREYKPSKVKVKYSYEKKGKVITETNIFEYTENVYYSILSALRIEREDLLKYENLSYFK